MWSDTSYANSDQISLSIVNSITETEASVSRDKWIYLSVGYILVLIGVFVFVRNVQKCGDEYEDDMRAYHGRLHCEKEEESESEFSVGSSRSRIFGYLLKDISSAHFNSRSSSVNHSRSSSYGTFRSRK
jgi:hypothetical protein